MKKIPMVLLMLSPYLLLPVSMLFGFILGESGYCAGYLFFFIIAILNMIYPFFLPKLNYSGNKILFWSMIVKIINIPVFVTVFIFSFALSLHLIGISIILGFVFDCVLLLPSSMYGVSGIIQCYKSGLFSKKTAVINIIMQILFCFDVFSAIYCYIKSSVLLKLGNPAQISQAVD